MFQRFKDLLFERVQLIGVVLPSRAFQVSAMRTVFEETAEQFRSLVPCCVQDPGIEVVVREGTDDRHGLAGPGDGHVQTTLTAFVVERTESHGKAPAGGFGVADAENDGIAFISLDPFEVLDEEPFAWAGVRTEEALEIGVVVQCLAECEVDTVGVPLSHGDDAKAEMGVQGGVIERQFHHTLDFPQVRSLIDRVRRGRRRSPAGWGCRQWCRGR